MEGAGFPCAAFAAGAVGGCTAGGTSATGAGTTGVGMATADCDETGTAAAAGAGGFDGSGGTFVEGAGFPCAAFAAGAVGGCTAGGTSATGAGTMGAGVATAGCDETGTVAVSAVAAFATSCAFVPSAVGFSGTDGGAFATACGVGPGGVRATALATGAGATWAGALPPSFTTRVRSKLHVARTSVLPSARNIGPVAFNRPLITAPLALIDQVPCAFVLRSPFTSTLANPRPSNCNTICSRKSALSVRLVAVRFATTKVIGNENGFRVANGGAPSEQL